ncbi:hypothetical protein [Endozoicomonas euniceicola]|uniref:Uncharacterized protein n=1 Tax=Endozoicomonas euniceicola TaxID=1234143 RepID=A0ABY6GVA5_9GAMM|nr:hypothetical protein [Endozoicomonas euniceicola]UYM16006.1 hypothetical protein NX720_24880 [Endozoicomonas euniceicola]
MLFLIIFFLLLNSHDSWAVVIKIINSSISVKFSGVYGSGDKTTYIYPIQIGNGNVYSDLTNTPQEVNLAEQEDDSREVSFYFSGFGNGNDSVLDLPEELQERLFQTLENRPDKKMDAMITCARYCYYLKTGDFRQEKGQLIESLVERAPEALEAIIFMNQAKPVHVALYVGHGVYMSKIGSYGVYFHSLQTVKDLYGSNLSIKVATFISQSSCRDGNHPPPDAGACGGASTSAY